MLEFFISTKVKYYPELTTFVIAYNAPSCFKWNWPAWFDIYLVILYVVDIEEGFNFYIM
jgi:hypothetical protein